jgi:hypothetical protein
MAVVRGEVRWARQFGVDRGHGAGDASLACFASSDQFNDGFLRVTQALGRRYRTAVRLARSIRSSGSPGQDAGPARQVFSLNIEPQNVWRSF